MVLKKLARVFLGERAKSGRGFKKEGNLLPASVGSPAAPPEYLEDGTEQKFPFPF
jgi:hypothetical protein